MCNGDGVLLRVGTTQTVDIDLKAMAAEEQITVSTETGLIDQSDPAGSLSIDGRSISDLPARGRNFPDFVLLTPSVIQESDRSGLVISGQPRPSRFSRPPSSSWPWWGRRTRRTPSWWS
jgi:hypothetical protein